MDLKKYVSKDLISVQESFTTKDEVITYLANQLEVAGALSDKALFIEDVYKREALSPTGIEAGLAIPHGKSKGVKKASFAAATLTTPINNWESVDPTNKVELIFLLAIPEVEAGDTHLQILAELSKRLVNADYRNALLEAKSVDAFYDILSTDPKAEKADAPTSGETLVLAVTACPAGIAHTYMAAQYLEDAGKKQGVRVRVEKQGANGIEDPFTQKELKDAQVVIFAADVAVKNQERFNHLPIYKTTVAKPIREAAEIIEKALAMPPKADGVFVEGADESDDKSIMELTKEAVLTGISYIIPLIVAGGMILTFAVFVSQAFGLQALYDAENSWLWMLRKLGANMLGTIMIPVLGAYISYSLADKPGLAPGFAAGIAANLIGSGFIGALIGGLVMGFFMRWFKKAVAPKGVLAGFVSFWVYPVVGSILAGVLMLLILGPPIAGLNTALVNFLDGLSGANAIVLGAVIGIMVSFDLGGPVNKAAYAFCIGAIAEGNFVPYAIFASVKMVSAFAVTMATVGFKQYYTIEEREIGNSTWILGLAGITEGAIPFMIKNPLQVITAMCVGSAITGAIVSFFSIGLQVPGAGIFSLFLLEQSANGVMTAAIWFFAAVIGAVITTAIMITFKMMGEKKQRV